jgi:hypothetical protein
MRRKLCSRTVTAKCLSSEAAAALVNSRFNGRYWCLVAPTATARAELHERHVIETLPGSDKVTVKGLAVRAEIMRLTWQRSAMHNLSLTLGMYDPPTCCPNQGNYPLDTLPNGGPADELTSVLFQPKL